MKRLIILLSLIFVGFIIIVAQNPKTNKAKNPKPGKNQPKEDIRVNREYDENGNLIKFDSIYSYRYSSDSDSMNFDFKDFPDSFGMNFNMFNDSAFNQSFFKDFDPFFGSFGQNQDSLMEKFSNMHHFHFRHDSTGQSFMDLDDFFNQFQEFKNDSNSSMQPFINEFNFSPKRMDEMMKIMEKHMQELQSHHEKQFKNQPEEREVH